MQNLTHQFVKHEAMAVGKFVLQGVEQGLSTGLESLAGELEAFDGDLFLTTNVGDAQRVIDEQTCAAATLKRPPEDRPPLPEEQVRIAFDGDTVLFDDASET